MQYNIQQISAETLEKFDSISQTEKEVITEFEISTTYNTRTSFSEINFFSLDDTLLLSDSNYKGYKVLQGSLTTNSEETSTISINPEQDIKDYMFDGNDVKILYNFLNNLYTDSNSTDDFLIKNISGDRTELRLIPLALDQQQVQQKTEQLVEQLDSNNYFNQFSLYTQDNAFYTATNIKIQIIQDQLFVVIKLYQALPIELEVNSKVSIVEQVAESIAFEGTTIPEQVQQAQQTKLKGPNFTIEVNNESNEQSEFLNYTELFSITANNNATQLNSLINEKAADISINYSNFSDFINYSSIEERLLNYKYKLELIQSYKQDIQALQVGNTTNIANTVKHFENLIKGITDNFDHYERHLHFANENSAWPKTNNTVPYTNELTTSQTAIDWYTDKINEARIYDDNNFNILTNTIPTYLKDDQDNNPYITFVNMIGHHFDNLWIYTKAVTDKYNADNRLNKGISKDLIEEVLTNFGIKLYSSQKSIVDLFKYFTQNSYDLEGESIPQENIIQQGEQVSEKQYEKEVYKRIYHNLPLLLKSKGTERGIKALVNCFGIPTDTLYLKYFGGRSLEDFPFLGGEQEFTSSIDKIRINNTEEIVPGNTLSQYTSIQKPQQKYTQDLHRVNFGFTPNNSVDELIKSSISTDFNIDDYIGDPQQIGSRSYKKLDKLFKTLITEIHQDRFNIKDFIRLIKFFDNTIFKMVQDFLPARTVSNKGVIIQPTLLDRSKVPDIGVSFTSEFVTSSLKTAFITGSYGESINGKSQNYTTNYKNTIQTPTGKQTKKWVGGNGFEQLDRSAEEAKYDGVLSGSNLTITNGELNENNPFKQINYKNLTYDLRFLSYPPEGVCVIGTTIQNQPYNYFQTNSSFTDNQGQLLPLDLSTLFSGQYGPTQYTVGDVVFTVPQNQQALYNIQQQFPGLNYINLNVNANSIDVDVNQQNQEGEPCDADVNVKVVFCNMITNQSAPIQDINQNIYDNINKYITYDLSNKFTENLNTDSIYLLKLPGETEVEININELNLEQLEQEPLFLPLPDQDTELEIKLQDNVDEDCYKTIKIPYTTCPLVDLTENSNIAQSAISNLLVDISGQNQPKNIPAILPSKNIFIPESIDPSRINYQEQQLPAQVMFRIVKQIEGDTPTHLFPPQEFINTDEGVVQNFVLIKNEETVGLSGLPLSANNINGGSNLRFQEQLDQETYKERHAIPTNYYDFYDLITNISGQQNQLYNRDGLEINDTLPTPSEFEKTNLKLIVRVELGQGCEVEKQYNYENINNNTPGGGDAGGSTEGDELEQFEP